MKTTNIYQKLLPSIINASITFLLSLPFLFLFGTTNYWKMSLILIFFIYNLVCEFLLKRCIGMIVVGTTYEKERTTFQKIVYITLYTISFATIFLRVFFPLDIFILNLTFVQLICIKITGNTLHGFLSGNIKTVIKSDN